MKKLILVFLIVVCFYGVVWANYMSLDLFFDVFNSQTTPVYDPGDSLLLETGDYLLLETGDKLLLE